MDRRAILLTSFVFVFFLVGGASGWDVNVGLIGYFPMNLDSNDCLDCDAAYNPCNDVNLILYGGAYKFYDATGGGLKSDSNVLFLDGVNDWGMVEPDDDGRLDKPFGESDITSAVTVACWIRSSNFGSYDMAVGHGYVWRLFGQPDSVGGMGKARFECMDRTSGADYVEGTTSLEDGEWHHVAGTYDGSNYKIYVDGVKDAADAAATGVIKSNTVSDEVTVGSHYREAEGEPKAGRYFDGVMDEVYIYKRALSEREIQNLVMDSECIGCGDYNKAFPVNPRGNGSVEVESVLRLEWWAGDEANDVNGHKVYFGTDASPVLVTDVTQPQTDPNYKVPYVLAPNTVYYWKVTEVNGVNEWAGVVLSFTSTAGYAKEPAPFSGKDNVVRDVNLSWTSGDFAEATNGHKVYFGSEGSLDSNGLPPIAAAQPQTATIVEPGFDLTLGEVYYWAVEGGNAVYTMPTPVVWSFTVSEYKVIDDFEGYPNDAALQAVWQQGTVYATAEVSQGGNGEPYHDIIAGDVNSMELVYACVSTGGPATLVRSWGSDQNWVADDIKTLTLFFHGKASNSLEPLKVKLEDANTVTAEVTYGDFIGRDPNLIYLDEDPNAMSDEWDEEWEDEWYQWDIELSRFSGVSLNAIKKLYITIGEVSSSTDGSVYFDNIRLYAGRCISELALGDFTGDCESDWADLNKLGDEWLLNDLLVTDFNAPLYNFPSDGSQWVAGHDGNDPNALQFDGVDDWVDINDKLLEDFQDKTITMWLRLDASNTDGNDLYVFGTSHYRQRLNIYVGGANSTRPSVDQDELCVTLAGTNANGNWISNSIGQYVMTPGTWVHVGLKLINTGTASSPTTDGRIYINGLFDSPAVIPNVARLAGALVGANLGSYDDGNGKFGQFSISDFRIYDEVLDDANMMAVKSDTCSKTPLLWYKFNRADPNALIAVDSGTSKSVYYPIDSEAETYEAEAQGSRVVNFKDYANMAAQWLAGKDLWP